MYPYSTQYLATEHARDLRKQAAVARRASEARRARRGPEPVPTGRGHIHRPGSPRWA